MDVAPSEITGPVLAVPGGRDDDRAVRDVRLGMLAVSMGEPAGEVQGVDQLANRVARLVAAVNDPQGAEAGALLPAVVRDLHTTLAAGHHVREPPTSPARCCGGDAAAGRGDGRELRGMAYWAGLRI